MIDSQRIAVGDVLRSVLNRTSFGEQKFSCAGFGARTTKSDAARQLNLMLGPVRAGQLATLRRFARHSNVSPAYLARETAPEAPEDLVRHRAIIIEGEDEDAVELHSGQVVRPYTPTAALLTNDYWVMKSFCLDGIGIALMPDFFVRSEVIRGGLVPVLPAWRAAPRRVHCAYRRRRYVGRKLRAFVDLMVRSIADIDSFNFYVGSPAKDGSGSDA